MKPSELPGARRLYRLTNRALAQIRELWQYAGEDELPPDSLLQAHVEKTIGAFYFLAFLALAGLFVPFKWPKAGWPLAATTLAVAVICSGIAVTSLSQHRAGAQPKDVQLSARHEKSWRR